MGVLIGPVEITWPKGCFYLPPSDGISARGKWDGKIGRLFLWHKQPVFEWSSKMLSPSLTIEPPLFPSHTSRVTLKWDPDPVLPPFRLRWKSAVLLTTCYPPHWKPDTVHTEPMKYSHCPQPIRDVWMNDACIWMVMKNITLKPHETTLHSL